MNRSVEYYLSKGYDQKSAEYFAGGRRTIIEVYANDDYSLMIRFDNGELRRLDLRESIEKGKVFAPLREIERFRRVYLDEQKAISWDIDPTVDSNVVWNNKIDLCPDSCYIDSVPLTDDENIDFTAKRILEKYHAAFEELPKG